VSGRSNQVNHEARDSTRPYPTGPNAAAGAMNLPAAGWVASHGRPGLWSWLMVRRRRVGFTIADLRDRPCLSVLVLGLAVVAVCGVLEIVNFRNGWLLYEDVSATVAPTAATIGVAIAARGELEYRRLRTTLAVALGLVAVGQILACVPDVVHAYAGPLATVSDVAYVIGAILGVSVLLTTLYGRLHDYERATVALNGLVIIAAAMTFVVANWLHQSLLPGSQAAEYFVDPTANLIVPLMSAVFFSSAAAAAVAALSLRVEPSRSGVWAVSLGIVLLSGAWLGWIGRFLSGAADGIEPMDFVFPAGALMTAWGGVSWTLRSGGRERYERFARLTSDWLPVLAIAGCAILDVMPRSRPEEVDPVAIGTCTVVFLAIGRLALSQKREREVRERLTVEMSERAAATVSLARLEAGPTLEESGERICAEALRIEGIDTVTVFGFTPGGVVPLAHGGPPTRAVGIGRPLPDDAALELQEHAAFGLWLENWSGKTPSNSFDRATVSSGLLAEAMAPLFWNDELVGVLALGAMTQVHARRLSDRLATLTEFSVMSAAMLGPALVDRALRETTIAEVRAVIATRAFTPVFQPIVDLETCAFVGYEALTRFSDGTRPDVRFLAADKVGMMVELERACLREQIADAHKLPEGAFLTLNLSPALAIEPEPLLDLIRRADRQVVLEVTEHLEIDDYSKLVDALARVRPIAHLAVDDAGAGYAGLRHILELRPQYVKLDISLVRNIDSDPARQAMVTGMAHFADSVGCSLIAEGIETSNELTALRLLRIPFGQGYHLARPAPIG
jgi:EAL domain-containing protein (putative c-di-GMP-specific phosphodiesterase class I)